MRVKLRQLPLALVLAASALIISGCSPEAAVPSAPPKAEAEPLFASDEEALEAAEAAYAEYLDVSNRILENGGEGGEQLAPLVSDEVFEEEESGFQYRRDNNLTSVGGTELIGSSLQQVIEGPEGTEVVAFVCLSYESVDVIDQDGNSVVPADRAPVVTYEATVAFESPDQWVLVSNEFWDEGSQCE